MTDHAHRLPWLPEGARDFLRKRATELVGLALMLGGIALILAIASFRAEDPSLNRATDQPAMNLLGLTGATIADLLLQSLGLASLLLAIVPIVWGWRLVRRHALSFWWLRLSFMPLAPLALAIAFAGVPQPAD